ncbi:MAG: homoserine dehydrogenase, partial [Deltaproteobacteria bacterium]|nr:homoserine dehydrogenase [Deltaproteobacteria bacterium]
LKNNRELIRDRLGAEIVVTHAVTAHPNKKRAVSTEGIKVSSNPADILNNPDIDIVVELIGGTTLAGDIVLKALDADKPVVTANKALLAERAREIFTRVYEKKLAIGMEASVAGGIPVLRSLKEGLSGDHILEVSGIVNGTCNYILTRMTQEGAPFDHVLADAQRLGYAEADPTFDVDGVDAAHKLAVLVNLAYGTMVHFPDIYREGIRGITPMDIAYARQLGFAIKLLAIGKRVGEQVEARVHPTLVSHGHLLASVNGVFNAVFLTGDNVDASMSYGRGAGGLPTGSAVVSDIIDIARNLLVGIRVKIPPLSVTQDKLRDRAVLPIQEIESEYYLRFQVLDRVGVLAALTRVMGDNNISIKSMLQPAEAEHEDQPVQVILTTHRALESDVQKSLKEIGAMDFIAGPAQLIRIERL